jgi:type 1 fimbriae regulatory protein FimB
MKSLTHDELDALLDVARSKSAADYLMLLVTFNHGLRASEVINLTRDNVVAGNLTVQRLKGSKKTSQPLLPAERALLLARAAETDGRLFPMCRMTFWRRMQEYGTAAGIHPDKLHPHILKHACGKLGFTAGMTLPEVQTYLGHVNGKNTMVYLEASEDEAAASFAAKAGK